MIVSIVLFSMLIFALVFFHPDTFLESSSKKHIIKSSIKTVICSALTVLRSRDTWIISIVGAITFGIFLALNTLWALKLLSNLELGAT
ncbi:major facilitator family transporter [Wolbachia endosymbiont of Brugia pahangi]|nr:major facilitator family transporter [Wolbachia endosymbiont of Brugia pahangi]